MQNIRNVAIVGSGQMGSGIAQVTASSGFNVMLADVNKKALDRAMKAISQSVTHLSKKQKGTDKVYIVIV